jgi:hypothetical protein
MKSAFLCLGLVLLCGNGSYAQLATTASPVPTPAAAAPKPDPSVSSPPAKDVPKSVKGGPVLPPEKSQPLRLVRFDKPPVIDGKLNDEVWKQAALFKDFYQWRPSDTAQTSAKTEVSVGYDSQNLYLAFHAFDDPSKVRATLAKRDQIFDNDVVGVFLDTLTTIDGRTNYSSILLACNRTAFSQKAETMISMLTS